MKCPQKWRASHIPSSEITLVLQLCLTVISSVYGSNNFFRQYMQNARCMSINTALNKYIYLQVFAESWSCSDGQHFPECIVLDWVVCCFIFQNTNVTFCVSVLQQQLITLNTSASVNYMCGASAKTKKNNASHLWCCFLSVKIDKTNETNLAT